MAPTRATPAELADLQDTIRTIEGRFGGQPQRLKFIMGGIRELSRVAAGLREDQLRLLPGDDTDEFPRALVERLADHLPVAAADPLARARTRGLVAQREMLDVEGPPVTVGEVAAHLRISRQAVDKRRQAGKLLAVSLGTRSYLYPRWQLTEEGVLRGLEDVLRILAQHPPWAQLRFFVSGNHRLGGKRPLDMLRQGRVDKVLRAAKAFGEHGAA
ncbi:MAG TPA: hypothetical protein PLI95_04455 [Polyangiaceae bacterium]|nr:hypothetical protein [Polyangiaceae bacterium]